jgi:thiamine pyrophosphokinase
MIAAGMRKRRALIIANGSTPSRELLEEFVEERMFVVCADGGANRARRMGIAPSVIIGDFDSITKATLRYFGTVGLRHMPDQNSTDLEKAITFCIREGRHAITIVGATGDRLDHATGALGCFKKFGGKADLTVVDDVCEITRIKKRVSFEAIAGEKISLIPLDRCSGITTLGLLYSLKNETLELGVREGISNAATGTRVSVSVKRGTLLLCRFRK